MTDHTTTETAPEDETTATSETGTETGTETAQTEPETFPREYVEKLRKEAADHRVRATDRDALAERLHTALVTTTGRLADPTDLPYDEDHLTDETALNTAIDDLLDRKPHLASRRIVGDIGQGATGTDTPVDLAGILRRNAS